MFHRQNSMNARRPPEKFAPCPGPIARIPRREFLRVGLSGFSALSLPALLRLRAEAGAQKAEQRTAIILVWLRGGASHLETYDPKPEAPSEYRGVFGPISTNVPGVQLCELLPRHAKIADKFVLLRSMTHTGGGHPAGSLQMLTGDTDPQDKDQPKYPDWMTIANYARSKDARSTSLPRYVGVNPVIRYDNFTIAGPGYLNPAYGPFTVTGDPNDPRFEVPNIGYKDPAAAARLADRVRLKQTLDRLERAVDNSGTMRAMDEFEAQALTLLTSPSAREAFDLTREPDSIRDRYGRNQWGQQCLMARRLVEAGVEIITTTFDGPLCGRVQNWDDHAVNHNVFDALQFRLPYFDQAISALIEDIFARGLDKRTLVIVTGEFGRTPRIEKVASSGGGVASAAAGTVQPGRDHWPRAFSQLWAGGGMRAGGVIGATDKRGEGVIDRPCSPGDFLATIYHHLGIEAAQMTLTDFSGRPNPILTNGSPIPELQLGS
jgi:uncharacterized protein (DUF1501 family)